METLKNFLIGISVLAMALIVIVVSLFAWPFLVGITSFVLSVIAVFLFVILIFYFVVLVGHLTRMLLSLVKKDKESSNQ